MNFCEPPPFAHCAVKYLVRQYETIPTYRRELVYIYAKARDAEEFPSPVCEYDKTQKYDCSGRYSDRECFKNAYRGLKNKLRGEPCIFLPNGSSVKFLDIIFRPSLADATGSISNGLYLHIYVIACKSNNYLCMSGEISAREITSFEIFEPV